MPRGWDILRASKQLRGQIRGLEITQMARMFGRICWGSNMRYFTCASHGRDCCLPSQHPFSSFPFSLNFNFIQPAMCLAKGQHFPVAPGKRFGQQDSRRNHQMRLPGRLHKRRQLSWEMCSCVLFSHPPVSYLEFGCDGWRSSSHARWWGGFEVGEWWNRKEKKDPGSLTTLKPPHRSWTSFVWEQWTYTLYKRIIWIFCYMQFGLA